MTIVDRGRTAMMRTGLSKPMAAALSDGLLHAGLSVFDYGCGRGGDVLRLSALGYDVTGWDPDHAASSPRREADIVNLGYVVNVIEDPFERVDVLRSAWSLARQLLVVAARPDWEARHVKGRRHGDGVLTTKGTFQKFFKQDELRSWIDTNLGARSIAAAPGIFYVFRDDSRGHQFLASRVRHGRSTGQTVKLSETLRDADRSLLDSIIRFTMERGRLPDPWEVSNDAEIYEAFGSTKRALAIVRGLIDEADWKNARETAQDDLGVYLALAAFSGRVRYSDLSDDMQLDVRALYGTYKAACDAADKLLFSVADQSVLNSACMSASFGKVTPEALYVHVSALSRLSPVLRVYEGCGRTLTGAVDSATLVKLNRLGPKVSYLAYPTFDEDPHPALLASIRADLRRLHVKYTDFSESSNPPILHRKETFVPVDYPGRSKFARLTLQEERAGLLADTATIGTRAGWQARLDQIGVQLGGHRLMREKQQ
ncbi:DNA phosphorothioation-associated putative methyltransferase [Actinosynnema sp. NPDC023794]